MVSLKKYLAIGVFFSIVVFFLACDEKIFTSDVNCEECYSDKPDSIDLIIHITLNDQFSEIPVLLYQGDIDNGILIDTFFCFADPATIIVEANNKYSARAIYQTDDRTVMVVDGTKGDRQLRKVSSQCDVPCWIIEDDELKLKLAF
jgi:hypothetical protein